MSERSTGHHHQHRLYEIRVTGHLESRWARWFDGLTLTNESGGTTVIRGPVADQAALHGLLRKLHDVGLPLISVVQVQPAQPDPAATAGAAFTPPTGSHGRQGTETT